MAAISRATRGPDVRLMGVRLDNLDTAGVVDHVMASLAVRRGGWIVTTNVDILRQAVADPIRAELVSRATLATADGMPLIWASRLQRTPLPERVAGSELIHPLARAAAARGLRLFFLGDAPDVARQAARTLRVLVPDLEIAGTYSPRIDAEEGHLATDETIRVLEQHAPDIVLCAFGFPKQETLMLSLCGFFPSTWFIGVGGSLSMIAGRTPPAPAWMRRSGLEWLHRLRLEPARLSRRYLVHDIPFALRLLAHSSASRFSRRNRRGSGSSLGKALLRRSVSSS